MNRINTQFKLAHRPVGPVKASDWQRAEAPVRALQDGEVLVQNLFISLDPAMRGWMNDNKASYIPPVALGEVMRALAVGKILESRQSKLAVGDHVHAPKGVDVYFDNVGGDILDTVLTRLARGARIVICGAISQYNATAPIKGPANYLSLLVNRASMTGMVVSDYYGRAMEAAMAMGGWMASGKLKTREDIVDGLDAFPHSFDMLFSGANHGKLVLKLNDPT
jgi:NADPH-dependent curcumin reductase CurA